MYFQIIIDYLMNMEAVYKHVRHFNEYNHYYTLHEQQKHSISFNISATVACNSDELTMKKKIHQSISDISNSPGNVNGVAWKFKANRSKNWNHNKLKPIRSWSNSDWKHELGQKMLIPNDESISFIQSQQENLLVGVIWDVILMKKHRFLSHRK